MLFGQVAVAAYGRQRWRRWANKLGSHQRKKPALAQDGQDSIKFDSTQLGRLAGNFESRLGKLENGLAELQKRERWQQKLQRERRVSSFTTSNVHDC